MRAFRLTRMPGELRGKHADRMLTAPRVNCCFGETLCNN